MRRHKVTVTTAGDGTATAYSPRVSGQLFSIHYERHATTNFTDGVDFTITSEATGETLWTEANVNASVVKNPRAATHTNVGVAALFAAGGVAVLDRIAMAGDRAKIVIAAGGAAKIGTFSFLVG